MKKIISEFIHWHVPKGKTYLLAHDNRQISEKVRTNSTYDYIVFVNLLEKEPDILKLLDQAYLLLKPDGRLLVIYRNFLHPFLNGLWHSLFQNKIVSYNWLSTSDIKTFLSLSHFDTVTGEPVCLTNKELPFLSNILNRFLLHFFPFNHLASNHCVTARKVPQGVKDVSVTIVIPARNEAGNIEKLVKILPVFGTTQEIIFVEGHSKDDTKNEIKRVIKAYKDIVPFHFKLIDQGAGTGKSDAVRQGFAQASGDLLIIFDADMSVKTNDLTKFYLTAINKQGDFINGSRLVYPMETDAMQFVNILGNKCFGLLYSWILGQPIKDTLCGTKVLWRKDYQELQKDKLLVNMYDPFGDFTLLMGAQRLNLKIVDLPVRYFERTYGSTNIKRFRNALELLRYSLHVIWSIKMRFSA